MTVTYYQTDNLELEFIDPPKVSWCLDGEELKTAKTKFNFSVNSKGLVHFSYKRYLENKLRENFDLEGTPIVIQFKNRSGE